MKINRDSGDPEEFEFQCEIEDIHHLIYGLKAALKILENSKLSLPGGAK